MNRESLIAWKSIFFYFYSLDYFLFYLSFKSKQISGLYSTSTISDKT